jgi:hypothetical protein
MHAAGQEHRAVLREPGVELAHARLELLGHARERVHRPVRLQLDHVQHDLVRAGDRAQVELAIGAEQKVRDRPRRERLRSTIMY